MRLLADLNAWGDNLWWQTHDRKVLKRVNLLIVDVLRQGNEGIGKPEPLKHDFGGGPVRPLLTQARTSWAVLPGASLSSCSSCVSVVAALRNRYRPSLLTSAGMRNPNEKALMVPRTRPSGRSCSSWPRTVNARNMPCAKCGAPWSPPCWKHSAT